MAKPSSLVTVGNPKLPQFRFAYDTEAKIVYVFRLGFETEGKDVVAPNIENLGAAINAVMIWSRGYTERSTEGEDHRRELVCL